MDEKYFGAIARLATLVGSGSASGRLNLALIGIDPTYPSEKYGYIIPDFQEPVSDVCAFKEKPN